MVVLAFILCIWFKFGNRVESVIEKGVWGSWLPHFKGTRNQKIQLLQTGILVYISSQSPCFICIQI
jgi:hypothetical protein